jgi:hypothetical protein
MRPILPGQFWLNVGIVQREGAIVVGGSVVTNQPVT